MYYWTESECVRTDLIAENRSCFACGDQKYRETENSEMVGRGFEDKHVRNREQFFCYSVME